jgi:parvulin-like peptidyl-prolyl isomerase
MRLPIGGLLRGLALAGAAAAGYVFGVTGDSASAQPGGLPGTPPAPLPAGVQPQPLPPAPANANQRVVAFITNPKPAPGQNALISITREELGEFLIARGGHEKLELLVNKRIIELEAARRGVTVTPVEIKSALEQDHNGLGLSLKDFEERLLPRYKKSLFEWVEDVIKPRLLLGKMCHDRVKITDDDLKRAFENKYGEQRQAKVISWTSEKAALKQWGEARKGDAEFDAIARNQEEPALASSCGLVKPLGRYAEAQSDKVEQVLFSLKEGEISELFQTPTGIMCLKLVRIIPKNEKVAFDDRAKAELTNELRTTRLDQEVAKFCGELKKAAQPQLLLTGPPSAAEFREGVGHIINNANANVRPAGGVPPARP